jgi:hypothetical protein
MYYQPCRHVCTATYSKQPSCTPDSGPTCCVFSTRCHWDVRLPCAKNNKHDVGQQCSVDVVAHSRKFTPSSHLEDRFVTCDLTSSCSHCTLPDRVGGSHIMVARVAVWLVMRAPCERSPSPIRHCNLYSSIKIFVLSSSHHAVFQHSRSSARSRSLATRLS